MRLKAEKTRNYKTTIRRNEVPLKSSNNTCAICYRGCSKNISSFLVINHQVESKLSRVDLYKWIKLSMLIFPFTIFELDILFFKNKKQTP